MKTLWYGLDADNNPVPLSSTWEGAEWIGGYGRSRVGQTYYTYNHAGRIEYVWVSTVFLALDHNFQSSVPILFETKVFNGER